MTRQTNQAVPTGAATDFKGGNVNDQEAKGALERVQALARYLDKLAPGDQHYANLIHEAIRGEQ